jgi:hypothetical protein
LLLALVLNPQRRWMKLWKANHQKPFAERCDPPLVNLRKHPVAGWMGRYGD